MTNCWILAADRDDAQMFRYHLPSGVIEALELQIPGTFQADTEADWPGAIAELLRRCRSGGTFDNLIMIVAPDIISELRQHLDAETAGCVLTWIEKDLNLQGHRVPELQRHVLDVVTMHRHLLPRAAAK
ncbi:MAG: host attachment protein [Planctomycetota bacterium]